MECKFCGKEIGDEFIFCPYCGKRVDGKKACPKCGTLIAEEFRYCPVCGTDTTAEKKPSADDAAKKKKEVKADPVKSAAAIAAQADLDDEFEEKTAVTGDEEGGASEESAPKESVATAGKGKLSATIASVKARLSRVNFKLLNKMILAVISAIFLLCSFFGVIGFDAEDMLRADNSVKLEGDIKCEFTAVDLMNIGFFALSLDYDKALDYVYNSHNDVYVEIEDILSDPDYVEVTLTRVTINSKGCREISKLISNPDLFKYSYADSLRTNGNAKGASVGVSWQVLGVLSLVNILCASVIFILALINLFKGFFKEGIWAVALMLLSSAGLWGVASGIGSAGGFAGLKVSMGAALAAIVAFSVIFFAYRLVVNLIESRKINVKQLVCGLVAVVTGAVVLGTASASVINTTLTYRADEESRKVTFKYSFSQFETFDEYYIDFGSGNYNDDETLAESFDSFAQRYSDVGYDMRPDQEMKNTFGLTAFTNSYFFGVTNRFAKPVIRLQPVFSLFAVYAAALMMSAGLVGLCGKRGKVRLKILSLVLFVLAAAMGIAVPITMNEIFTLSTHLTMIGLSVGVAPIVTLVFAVIGAVGFGIANIFKKKEICFEKKSKEVEL